MPAPRILILRAPGTNCDLETAFAFEQAGGRPDFVHINRLLETPSLCGNYQVLCLPGGFSYGDDIAAGRILANQIHHHLRDVIQEFRDAGKLILGICNGFQILIKSGVLADSDSAAAAAATLTWNDSGRFEDRWVHLATKPGNSVFLRGLEHMYLPIAHAEGKFVARDQAVLDQLADRGQLVLRYCDADGNGWDSPLPFPLNPNGSVANVAGICDETGRVLGLMPHPERHIDQTHHPRWTRGEGNSPGDGMALFVNAVDYFQH
jgi:phosphoribosylformylglycinamidine synthase